MLSSSTYHPLDWLKFQPAIAWIGILGLAIITALGTFAGAGSLLRLLFPAGAFAVGLLLYFRYPILYIGFTWWLWFITPLVRRLIDYQSGWQDPSPVLLAPPLVTMICGLTLFRHLPTAYSRGGLPFLMCFTSVFYGFMLSLVKSSVAGGLLALLDWLPPLLFGFHLSVNWRQYLAYRQNLQRTFLWGVLVMGAYGLWQYLTAPLWDRFWLENAGSLVFGQPEPMGIRVWSTMNSPQPFAAVMVAGLILLLSNKETLKFAATGVGYLSFLLSLARAGWVSWMASLLVYISSLKSYLQMRLFIALTVMVMLVAPLVAVEPLASEIVPRLASLSETKDDGSYKARAAGYSELLDAALLETLGEGLAFQLQSGSLGSRDSGVLTLMFSLGWLGTLPYLTGLFLMLYTLFQTTASQLDEFALAARAIALGLLAQIGLNVSMLGVSGMVLWGFLGIGLSAAKYNTQLQRANQAAATAAK